jgi:hypothetical protein
MTTVTDLDLPVFDYAAPDFAADRYLGQLAEARAQGWLARSPLAFIVLVEGIYGIEALPLRWDTR